MNSSENLHLPVTFRRLQRYTMWTDRSFTEAWAPAGGRPTDYPSKTNAAPLHLGRHPSFGTPSWTDESGWTFQEAWVRSGIPWTWRVFLPCRRTESWSFLQGGTDPPTHQSFFEVQWGRDHRMRGTDRSWRTRVERWSSLGALSMVRCLRRSRAEVSRGRTPIAFATSLIQQIFGSIKGEIEQPYGCCKSIVVRAR